MNVCSATTHDARAAQFSDRRIFESASMTDYGDHDRRDDDKRKDLTEDE